MEVLGPRRASLTKKYIEELRVDTTGFLAGADTKEIKRVGFHKTDHFV